MAAPSRRARVRLGRGRAHHRDGGGHVPPRTRPSATQPEWRAAAGGDTGGGGAGGRPVRPVALRSGAERHGMDELNLNLAEAITFEALKP
jgi:hypothetical protein